METNKKVMKAFFPLLIGAVLLSCKTEELASDSGSNSSNAPTVSNEQNQPSYDSTFVAELGELTESDPINIIEAAMIGENIKITVEYSGGCQPHEFKLVGNPVVMKSLPPKRVIKLIHNANGDNCRMLIRKTFLIDATNLSSSDASGTETVLILEAYKGDLKLIKQ